MIITLRVDTPFLGTRRINDGVAHEYVWRSHQQVRQSIESYGRGLVSLGLGRQKAIGVYSINRPEWVSEWVVWGSGVCTRQAACMILMDIIDND